MSNTLERTSSPGLLMPVVGPSQMLAQHTQFTEFIKGAMKDGVDYGSIPGTADDKKTLLKPGAEKLLVGCGLTAQYDVITAESDHDRIVPYEIVKWVPEYQKPSPEDKKRGLDEGELREIRNKQGGTWLQRRSVERGNSYGLYSYTMNCKLLNRAGEVVGQGVGHCSTMETKYIRNPRDLGNTVLKLAKKRALVDAVLSTFGLSERFNQDLEDLAANTQAAADPHQDYEPEPAEVDYLTISRPCNTDEQAEADRFLKECGLSKNTYQSFTELCAKAKKDPRFVLLAAKRSGLKTSIMVLNLAKSLVPGDEPGAAAAEPVAEKVEAEVVE